MTDFKVGDKVRVINRVSLLYGETGKVLEVADHPYSKEIGKYKPLPGVDFGKVYLIGGIGKGLRDVWQHPDHLELVGEFNEKERR